MDAKVFKSRRIAGEYQLPYELNEAPVRIRVAVGYN
jgi:hypothetical protein